MDQVSDASPPSPRRFMLRAVGWEMLFGVEFDQADEGFKLLIMRWQMPDTRVSMR